MKFAIKENGIITQVINATKEFASANLGNDWFEVDDKVNVGYYYSEEFDQYIPTCPVDISLNSRIYNPETYSWDPLTPFPEGCGLGEFVWDDLNCVWVPTAHTPNNSGYDTPIEISKEGYIVKILN